MPKTKRGLFIAFEGIDGSGTSTHVHKLEERIEDLDKYQDVIRTHEPWKNEEIKRKLENDKVAYSDGLKMAGLYIEDRTQHTRQIIRPALEEQGIVILCKRYKMSTCAYQWAQGVPLHDLLSMHNHRGLLVPDLTFYLDIPRKVAERRIERRKKTEKFEKDPRFTEKLIKAYNALLGLSEADPRIFGKVVRIDGNRRIQQVSEDIFSEFLPLYNSWISRNR